MDRARVLVIEDEEPIRVGLCDVLAFHGMEPEPVGDGEAGLRAALDGDHVLLVVDVMLPGLDGFSITRAVRERRPSVPILLLTAKGAEADVLAGFAAGADDYVTKPFSVAQLMARIRALLRRGGASARQRFVVADATIDADALKLSTARGEVDLSPRDVALLAYLFERKGSVVARDELLREVWGYARTDRVETRCIDMHLSKLRRKVAAVTDDDLVQTVRGAGYRVP